MEEKVKRQANYCECSWCKWRKYEKEYEEKSQEFRKVKSTIMIEGEKDPEAGEVDKGERTPWLKKKELNKGKEGDNKSWDYSEKKRKLMEP